MNRGGLFYGIEKDLTPALQKVKERLDVGVRGKEILVIGDTPEAKMTMMMALNRDATVTVMPQRKEIKGYKSEMVFNYE